jgi:hypothetical protein
MAEGLKNKEDFLTMLEKLNKFTRREFQEDEVYIFDVILCDNDIDRDYEAFSDSSLETLKSLFIGKTGIFDHNPKGSNQTARIFDTEIITDNSKLNRNGTPYKYLKGCAYMIRTSSNADLIKEIDGGIKKEVSVSCSADRRICSICGTDRTVKSCVHIKGKKYGSKLCCHILENISDAYEWSFVAVPAQINAGVTKKYNSADDEIIKSFEEELRKKDEIIDLLYDDIRKDVTRLCFLSGSASYAKALESACDKMDICELTQFRRILMKEYKGSSCAKSQLSHGTANSFDDFRIQEVKL